MHVKTNDIVQVVAGKEKGKTGRVLRVDRRRNRVLVEGLNIIKRHQKQTGPNTEAAIVEREGPIHASNVLIYSEQEQRGVRVGYRFVGRGGEYYTTRKAALESFGDTSPERVEKVRFCSKTGEVFQ